MLYPLHARKDDDDGKVPSIREERDRQPTVTNQLLLSLLNARSSTTVPKGKIVSCVVEPPKAARRPLPPRARLVASTDMPTTANGSESGNGSGGGGGGSDKGDEIRDPDEGRVRHTDPKSRSRSRSRTRSPSRSRSVVRSSPPPPPPPLPTPLPSRKSASRGPPLPPQQSQEMRPDVRDVKACDAVADGLMRCGIEDNAARSIALQYKDIATLLADGQKAATNARDLDRVVKSTRDRMRENETKIEAVESRVGVLEKQQQKQSKSDKNKSGDRDGNGLKEDVDQLRTDHEIETTRLKNILEEVEKTAEKTKSTLTARYEEAMRDITLTRERVALLEETRKKNADFVARSLELRLQKIEIDVKTAIGAGQHLFTTIGSGGGHVKRPVELLDEEEVQQQPAFKKMRTELEASNQKLQEQNQKLEKRLSVFNELLKLSVTDPVVDRVVRAAVVSASKKIQAVAKK